MSTKSKILAISAVYLLIVIAIAGCQPKWVNDIGSDMDKLAKGYEKFGTVTMSSPILVEAKPEPNNGNNYFYFNLPTGPNEYYNDALSKVQGQSAIFDQYVKTSGLSLEVQADVPTLMGYIQTLSDYYAQRTFLSQAAELKAQEMIAHASAGNIKEAEANAAEIRAQAYKGMSAYPSIPPCNLPSIKNAAPEAKRSQGVLSDSNFMEYLGLLEGGKGDPVSRISNRSAITTAAGDTATEGIFRLLGNPAAAMQFRDKIIMFGVSMVSVNPGWLTKKNYTAELAISCDYSYEPARRELLIQIKNEEAKKSLPEKDKKLIELIECALKEESMNKSEVDNIIIPERLQKKFREIYTPLSAAVSPMTDVDALDLGYSQRFQVSDALSIAAALSAGGSKASAAYFREWAKRRQQDVRTRTSYAAVTSFSNGGFFGWRIKPRLQALENPALFESKPENVLEQQAFPAVVIVGIDTDDLQLGFDVKSEPNGKSRLAAYEPMISFRQSVSWLPNQSTCNLRERLSETERLRSAYNFIQAHEDLNSVIITDQNGTRFSSKQKNPTPKSDVVRDADRRVIDFIKNRITLLRYHTLDSWNAQYIPIELMVRRVAANKTDPNTKGKK